MTRKLSSVAVKFAALAAFAFPVAIALNGCGGECVDKFDCKKYEVGGKTFTCVMSKCVEGDPGGNVGGGAEAGGAEAGGSGTAGGGAAGGSGGGSGTAGGGTAGGTGTAGGGMAGGAGGGTAGGGTAGGGISATANFVATLTGAQQEDPTTMPVVTFAHGTATVAMNTWVDGGVSLDVNVTHDAGSPLQAHIHGAWAGQSGGVLVGFTSAASPIVQTVFVTPTQAATIASGGAYINVHTTMYMNGEIRGQILRPSEQLWTTKMEGANEIPPVVTTDVGTFGAIVHTDGGTTYAGVLMGFNPTAAHIHQGGPLEPNGTVIQNLTTIGNTALGGDFASANVFGTGDGGYYVNVHTAPGTTAHIRGPLTQKE